MAQVYTVTASTSVVLISSLQTPNTVVLLSSMRYPGHIVGIRDITGSNEITQNPIIISTISGIKFYDGTSSVLINKPNGFVSLSSRDSSTWQLLNSAGFLTTLSTGFLETLTTQRVFVLTTSTIEAYGSSLTTANVNISKSLEVLGNTNIQGDIQIGGSFNVFSTLHAFHNMNLSTVLDVQGDVSFASSLFIRDGLTVGSNLSTFQNATVSDNLLVSGNFYGADVLRPLYMPYLSVQTLAVSSMNVGGGIQLFGGISTQTLNSFSSLTALGTGIFKGNVTVARSTIAQSSFTLDGNLTTSTFLSYGDSVIHKGVTAGSYSSFGLMSTFQFMSVSKSTLVGSNVTVNGPFLVTEGARMLELTVYGSSILSSVVTSTLFVAGYVSSQSSTFVTTTDLNVTSSFVIGQDLLAGGRGAPYMSSLFSNVSYLSSVNIANSLLVGGLLDVPNTTFVKGDITGINSLVIQGTLSTSYLVDSNNVFLAGTLSVGGTAYVSTVGAPTIDLKISTLALSNALVINYLANIPSLEVGQNPVRMAAGSNFTRRGVYDLYVDGILQNNSTVFQTNTVNPRKLWTANTLQASTLSGSSNVSSVLIGSSDFFYPFNLSTFNGIVVGGSNMSGGANLYYASNVSSTFYPCEPATSLNTFYPNRVRFNGSNMWVAVGSNLFSLPSIFYSTDGYYWYGGLSTASLANARDVVYGGGKWVVVGSNSSGSQNIWYSLNGVSWTVASSAFSNSGFATSVAYNGTSQWIAAGSEGGVAVAKYSTDGITWNNLSIPIFSSGLYEPYFRSVVYGNEGWYVFSYWNLNPSLYPISPPYKSLNGLTFTAGATFDYPISYNAYGGLHPSTLQAGYMFVGPGKSNMMDTTIIFGQANAPTSFIIKAGVFTDAALDVIYDSNTRNWYAAGYNSTINAFTVANSPVNGVSWQKYTALPGRGYTISPGLIRTPMFLPYFTPNVTSIFHSTLSSQSIIASTVVASSIQGNFFGDGSLITGVTRFNDSLATSSLQVLTKTSAANISSLQTIALYTQANNSITVEKKPFFSTGIGYFAAGNDYIAKGSIQVSADGSTWAPAITSNFQNYGNDIIGNDIATAPLFVAVGADSRAAYTIQWSRDGVVWSPAASGGFSNADSDGICKGTSIAYKDSVWVALGVDPIGSNTIQYSLDGSNWQDSTSGKFSGYGTKVKVSLTTTSIRYFVASGNGGLKYSSDGITWTDTAFYRYFIFGYQRVYPTITAFGPGRYTSGGPFYDGWISIATSNDIYTASNFIPDNFYFTAGGGSFALESPINDILWVSGTNWIGVGGTSVRNSALTGTWPTTSNLPVINLNTIIYNSAIGKYFIGGSATTPNYTIWSGTDGYNWSASASGSGFSTSVESYGQGYGIVTLGISTFAVGKAALNVETSVGPSILHIISSSQNVMSTQVSLTASNASNVFQTVVRAIAGSESQAYKYVAVGDGVTPQKTIARSQLGSPNTWIPAITGGFSTTGYGVTYFANKWIAVGDAESSRNVIQYSPDGANWFGTNNASAIRSGGRGIAVGYSNTTPTVVVGGKDTNNNTFACSTDGFTWTVGTGEYFDGGANAIAGKNNVSASLPTTQFVAVGRDTRGSSNTILRSFDGKSWSLTSAGGGLFSTTGFGVAFGSNIWVAVGEDPNPNNTILYSTDDAASWYTISANGFTGGGYGVTYNNRLSTFFAVGKDINGDGPLTIKYSKNASSWSNFSTGGFLSQKSIGSANGITVQGFAATELIPYMDFSNLVVYEKQSPLLYPKPSIRVSTNYIAFSEGLFVNLSSQISIGENNPYENVAVTVRPYTTFVSSLIYTTSPYLSSQSIFSSIIVSTLITDVSPTVPPILTNPLETPSLAINIPYSYISPFMTSNILIPKRFTHDKANDISPEVTYLGQVLHINDCLDVKPQTQNITVGPINTAFFPIGGGQVNINGSLGVSSLVTQTTNTLNNFYISAPRIFYSDDSMTMFSGSNPSLVTAGNTIYTTPSSITFNSFMTLQVSTQKIGVFTDNPKFQLDVMGAGVLSTVQVNTVNTSLLFFSLQALGFTPIPIATYDFNSYTVYSATIANQAGGAIGAATVSLETYNTFVETNPSNKYLTIYAPDNYPSPTGGITTPSISGIYSVEMWVRLSSAGTYGQYFVDFRTGLSDGYIIGAGGAVSGNVGPGWTGKNIYYNTVGSVLTATTNVVTTLNNNGWFQVVLVTNTPFTAYGSFFYRFSGVQGMPLSVAEISIYNVALSAAQIKELYNNKCSRYGLSPV